MSIHAVLGNQLSWLMSHPPPNDQKLPHLWSGWNLEDASLLNEALANILLA
jgi:hypothetical protein